MFNPLQKATLGVIGGLNLETKKVGDQLPLVERFRDGLAVYEQYSIKRVLDNDIKQNPFLYSAIRKKADSIASVPFYVEEFKDGEWVRALNHPAENLIENANPYMSGAELKKLLVYHKDLTGSAYMQIVLVKGEPQFLQPLFPQFMKVVPSRTDFIAGFEYTIDGVRKELGPKSVFWTKHADPGDPYRGLSPLEAIAAEVQTDLEARKWNKISLANRGAGDVAFIMRSVTTEEQYEFARKMIEDRISGPDNARRPWVLGGDSDVRPLSYTAVEMDYINTRKFNREVISAALGVPAPLIGDADNSTYNNLDTLKQDFWQGTLTNWLEELRQDLTRQILIPYYSDKRYTKAPQIRYMYDLSGIEALQIHIKDKAETAKVLRDAGFSLRAVNTMLEFGVDMDAEDAIGEQEYQRDTERATAEAEAAAAAAPTPEPAEAAKLEPLALNMATAAYGLKDSPSSFAAAIVSINETLCGLAKSTPDPIAARERAERYLSCYNVMAEIQRGELAACER